MPWYRAGTVAIVAGQTTVIGTGTNFAANARVGDAFQGPDGRWYEVTNTSSATVLSIFPGYQGGTVAAGGYGLAPMQGYVKESADRLRQIIEQWGSTLAGLGAVSTENVVPVTKGGTGGTTAAAARGGLGLGSAATRNVGVAAGELMEKGAYGLGAVSAPGATFTGLTGFSVFPSSASPVPGAGGAKITQNVGGNLFSEFVIVADSASSPTVAVRQYDANGSPGPWNKFYTTGNTTRAADGTLKAT